MDVGVGDVQGLRVVGWVEVCGQRVGGTSSGCGCVEGAGGHGSLLEG